MVRLLAFLALTSLVGAIPTTERRDGDVTNDSGIIDPWDDNAPPGEHGIHSPDRPKVRRDGDGGTINDSGIIDPWDDNAPPGEHGLNSPDRPKAKRDGAAPPSNISGLSGKIPGCDSDPSKPGTANTSKYKVGDGSKVPKNGQWDECNQGDKGNDHCWTEYWLVEQNVEFSGWREQGDVIHCASAAYCDSATAGQTQACTTTGTSNSSGLDVKIIELSVQAEVDFGWWKGTAGASGAAPTTTSSKTDSTQQQTCVSNQNSRTCRWTDGQCHQLFVADRVLHIYGYTQRVCLGRGNGTPMNQQRDSDKNWIRGMADFDYFLPAGTVLGCGGKCDSTKYDDSLPPPEPRQKFPAPANWAF